MAITAELWQGNLIALVGAFGGSQKSPDVPSGQNNLISAQRNVQTLNQNTTINNAQPPEASILKHSTDKEVLLELKEPVEMAYIKFDDYVKDYIFNGDSLESQRQKQRFQGKTVNWIGKFVDLTLGNPDDGRLDVNFRPLKNSFVNMVSPYKCIVPESEELFLRDLVLDQKIRCIGILNGIAVTADKVELVEENN